MPSVLNIRKVGRVPNAAYIGRPSKWGNPFEIGRDGTRHEVVEKYKQWILTKPELIKAAKKELAGKDLLCFCAPLECHGDVLIRIANGEEI